jgi:putative flippase GtrA
MRTWIAEHRIVRRVVGCMSVSVATTCLSVSILVTLAFGFGVSAGIANLVGVACGIPPSYFGNRRFVWKRRGRHDVAREVVPFWLLSIGGLIASTWLVANVGTLSAHWPAAARGIALPAASVAVFGSLWLLQFAFLDRVIFRDRRAQGPDAIAIVASVQ